MTAELVDAGVRVKALLVEDDAELSRALARKLTADGIDVEVANEPTRVITALDQGTADWDVVLLDVGLPGISGIDLLLRFRESASLSSVIMLTGDNTANTAAACMRAGAFHYLTKPFRPFELSSMVHSAARYSTLRRQLAGIRHRESPESMLIGNSTAMRRMRAGIERLAKQSVSILIQGESGTGKELVARALHDLGPRHKH